MNAWGKTQTIYRFFRYVIPALWTLVNVPGTAGVHWNLIRFEDKEDYTQAWKEHHLAEYKHTLWVIDRNKKRVESELKKCETKETEAFLKGILFLLKEKRKDLVDRRAKENREALS